MYCFQWIEKTILQSSKYVNVYFIMDMLMLHACMMCFHILMIITTNTYPCYALATS